MKAERADENVPARDGLARDGLARKVVRAALDFISMGISKSHDGEKDYQNLNAALMTLEMGAEG